MILVLFLVHYLSGLTVTAMVRLILTGKCLRDPYRIQYRPIFMLGLSKDFFQTIIIKKLLKIDLKKIPTFSQALGKALLTSSVLV